MRALLLIRTHLTNEQKPPPIAREFDRLVETVEVHATSLQGETAGVVLPADSAEVVIALQGTLTAAADLQRQRYACPISSPRTFFV
jgi:hypothetical protein